MSRLLQRLARQAIGGGGPRIRSAAAVHAQRPIAAPLHQPRATVDARPTLEARFQTTTALAAASRDAGVHESRSPADAGVEPRTTRDGVRQATDPLELTHELSSRGAVGEGMTRFDDQLFGSIREQRPPLVPPPLIGTTAAPRPGSLSGPVRSAVARETKTAQDREPTEVHVHIGQIEVTALPAPAAPQPRARAARPSVPLSDYLAKRRPS